jgi:hypothetical protein
MDFTSEPSSLKKSHSVEPIHHITSHQLFQTPIQPLHNQHSYPAQQQQHYYQPPANHHHAPVAHNNYHFGHFQQHLPYGQPNFQHTLQHNPNVGYVMHGGQLAGFQSQPPVAMNMNINMYANNINLNFHPEPLVKITDPERNKQ